MESIKNMVSKRLNLLNQISFNKPTAMQLRQQQDHMLNRVQRIEDKRFQRLVEDRKIKLRSDVKNIRDYEKRLFNEKLRRQKELKVFNEKLRRQKELKVFNEKLRKQKELFDLDPVKVQPTLVKPIFQPINVVVPKPQVVLQNLPQRVQIIKRTNQRFGRYR